MKYEIGNRIRQYREARKISQKQLAEELHISNSRISNWEQGINRPDADILVKLCEVLKVSPSLLLGVKLSADELSEHEWEIIKAYRSKTDLQKAINILLGLEKQQ